MYLQLLWEILYKWDVKRRRWDGCLECHLLGKEEVSPFLRVRSGRHVFSPLCSVSENQTVLRVREEWEWEGTFLCRTCGFWLLRKNCKERKEPQLLLSNQIRWHVRVCIMIFFFLFHIPFPFPPDLQGQIQFPLPSPPCGLQHILTDSPQGFAKTLLSPATASRQTTMAFITCTPVSSTAILFSARTETSWGPNIKGIACVCGEAFSICLFCMLNVCGKSQPYKRVGLVCRWVRLNTQIPLGNHRKLWKTVENSFPRTCSFSTRLNPLAPK